MKSFELKIIAKVLDEYNATYKPQYLANLTSSERTYPRVPDLFPKMFKTYNAYEKDIAVLQVSFTFPLQNVASDLVVTLL